MCKRESAKYADYVLFYKAHIPIAIVEAKDNNHCIGDGMQQALDYANKLLVPFVFTSNGDGFTFHNRISTNDCREQVISLGEFPSPEYLWELYKGKVKMDDSQERIAIQPYHMEREDKTPRYYQLNAINLSVDATAMRPLWLPGAVSSPHPRRGKTCF